MNVGEDKQMEVSKDQLELYKAKEGYEGCSRFVYVMKFDGSNFKNLRSRIHSITLSVIYEMYITPEKGKREVFIVIETNPTTDVSHYLENPTTHISLYECSEDNFLSEFVKVSM